MPVLGNIIPPTSASELKVLDRPLFVAFISSNDPTTGQSWCPDVRIALPLLNSAFFSPEAPELAFIEVGQRPWWKAPNIYRTEWNVHNVPTLVKFELVDGVVKETVRLEEEGIKDAQSLKNFSRN